MCISKKTVFKNKPRILKNKNINKEIRQEKMNFYSKLNTRDSTDNKFFGKRKNFFLHIKYKLNLK